MLESVATALADLSISVRAVCEQIREEPALGEHRCVMPADVPLLTIHRCPCGTSWRLSPALDNAGRATWRQI
jgi:hypothetical protein